MMVYGQIWPDRKLNKALRQLTVYWRRRHACHTGGTLAKLVLIVRSRFACLFMRVLCSQEPASIVL